jgi:hypothetical protein
MAPMRARLALVIAALLAAGALIAGCGGDAETTGSSGDPGPSAESRAAPPKSDFPSPEGRNLKQLLKLGDKPAELKVEPGAMVFYKGENRYPFGVYKRDRTPVDDAEVALYLARVPTVGPGAKSKAGNKGQVAKAEGRALDQPAIGPFPARIETLATEPEFAAESTTEDAGAPGVVYSTQINFPSEGKWLIAALIKEGDELGGSLLQGAEVGTFKSIPRAGERPPVIHTPTAADVGGDLSKLTTRVPPEVQNKVDYADALGKEPIVLLFATPQFCQSRVCGPVVDVTEQAKREYGDQAAFIHMEIFNNNDPGDDVRPQVRAFRLPSEPWLFTIDRRGVISDAVEGAFGLELLDGAIEKAIR